MMHEKVNPNPFIERAPDPAAAPVSESVTEAAAPTRPGHVPAPAVGGELWGSRHGLDVPDDGDERLGSTRGAPAFVPDASKRPGASHPPLESRGWWDDGAEIPNDPDNVRFKARKAWQEAEARRIAPPVVAAVKKGTQRACIQCNANARDTSDGALVTQGWRVRDRDVMCPTCRQAEDDRLNRDRPEDGRFDRERP